MTLLDELPNLQRRAIDLVREAATEKDLHPFLVGGPVRDLLLGRHSIDIDVTIEEGASALARAVAKKVNARVRSFPQFLTYKVVAADLAEIDIATARRERYRTPGALPTVTAGKLRDDLLRRDFSINAIALDLRDESIHDPASGRDDLERRQIRILHEKSFMDDPTRILRAIRLAVRLDFNIESQTNERMRQAIRSGALATVSRERIWRELFLAMEETEAPRVLAAIVGAGVTEALFKRTSDRGRLRERLDVVRRQAEADLQLDRHVLYTAALLEGDASPVDLEGSGFSQKRARNVVQLANELPRYADALSDAGSERQRFRLYRSASPEMLSLLAATLPQERDRIARYQQFRGFKLSLRGNDLEMPGGPHIARALERTREAVFTGEIAPDQARSFAREVAIRYLEEGREGR